ncbi:uncharacterized protein LOC131615843 [Vicia villosa]|uniref:uncharacterized protein LOC131615843 n=1 Tax=Vicia villosa TaxID=3911 RepID=UPI00273A964E|nr:uncharacterized protein LOC131615843 [Vicia villosa]
MPTISRRKTKQAKKKTKPLNLPNQHSSTTVQLQTKGPFVSENRSEMEGNFNGVLHDTRKVEDESSSEDKEVAVEVFDDDVYDGKSKCVSDEHVESCKVVEEEEDVSERVGESLESSDAIEADRVEDIEDSETVKLEFKKEKVEDDDVVEENEGLRESEVVETVRDVTVGEDENVLSTLPSLDVVSVSRESDDVVEKVISPKGVEEPLVKSTYEEDEEQLDVQESSSAYESAKESFQPSSNVPSVNEQEESSAYESAKESLQPSSNVHDSENNSVNEQDRVEESRGIENQGSIFSVTQRQPSSWKNCCGLLEVLRHGDR